MGNLVFGGGRRSGSVLRSVERIYVKGLVVLAGGLFFYPCGRIWIRREDLHLVQGGEV